MKLKDKFKDVILDLFGPAPEPDRPAPPRARPSPPAPVPPASPLDLFRADARGEGEILAVLRREWGEFRHVKFTRNRRVMASVGRDRVVRLNVAFATAPEEVLKAVGVLFSPGRGRRKQQAKETLQRFIDAIPPADVAASRGPRRRRVHPLDRVHVERLQAEFDRTNRLHFGGRLPRVPLHLSRKMRRRNGHFSSHPLEIVISHRLCAHGAHGEAEQTVRHEMIHLWQYISGAAVDHGPAFRRMARRLDVHPRATRPVQWRRKE